MRPLQFCIRFVIWMDYPPYRHCNFDGNFEHMNQSCDFLQIRKFSKKQKNSIINPPDHDPFNVSNQAF